MLKLIVYVHNIISDSAQVIIKLFGFLKHSHTTAMSNFFYFSDYIKSASYKMRFALIVIMRFLRILFKWRKNIELVILDYTERNIFQNSYLIIHYRFKNALWYNFKTLKQTTEAHSIVFNLKNLSTTNITLIVHGFFQKKLFQINIGTKKALETKTFKTILSGISINKKIIFADPIKPDRKQILLILPQLDLIKANTITTHSPYNKNDFI